jgi:hypothetical protein
MNNTNSIEKFRSFHIIYNNELILIEQNIVEPNMFIKACYNFDQNIDFNMIENDMNQYYEDNFSQEIKEILIFFQYGKIDLSIINYQKMNILFDYFLFSYDEYKIVVQQNYKYLQDKYFFNELNCTKKINYTKSEYNSYVSKLLNDFPCKESEASKNIEHFEHIDRIYYIVLLLLEIYHFCIMNLELLSERFVKIIINKSEELSKQCYDEALFEESIIFQVCRLLFENNK